ncbi:MAG: hypothetical protein ABL997_08740, partial [Planctomycetota bacterium]
SCAIGCARSPTTSPATSPARSPPGRASTPRPSRPSYTPATPSPTYTPPSSSNPSTPGSRPRPTYTPRPAPQSGGIRTPGASKPNPNNGSVAQPSTPGARPTPKTPTPPRATGGGVRVPDRYQPATRPRTDTNGTASPGGRPRSNGSGVQVKPSSGAAASKPRSALGAVTGPQVVDRYVPNRPNAGPRDVTGPRSNPRPQPPTTRPLETTAGRPRQNVAVPNLIVRPRSAPNSTFAGATRHYYGGTCYGPVWSPVRSWGYWNPHCSSSFSWNVGFGSSSFCWGWSSWQPWTCYYPRSRWFSSWGYCWWDPWYSSCATPIWWMPASYCSPLWYQTSYVNYASPSTVIVVDRPASDDTIYVGAGAAELTPEEQGRRYADFGDYYFKEGRFRDAADAYAKARSLLPGDASLHFVMADAVFALADYHFAAFLIGEALRLEPGLARAETDKRLLYKDPAVFEEQMAALRRYLEAKPYDAMAHLVLGYNLKFSLQEKAAEAAFARVLEIEPSNPSAPLFLEALRAAKVESAPSETGK